MQAAEKGDVIGWGGWLKRRLRLRAAVSDDLAPLFAGDQSVLLGDALVAVGDEHRRMRPPDTKALDHSREVTGARGFLPVVKAMDSVDCRSSYVARHIATGKPA